MPTSMKLSLHVFGGAVAVVAIAAAAYLLLIAGSVDRHDVRASFDGVRTLVVTSDRGAVSLHGVRAGRPLDVVEHVTRGPRSPQRSATRGAGGVLTLSGQCRDGGVGPCEVGYEIAVPAGTRVLVDTGTGPIRVVGLAGGADARLSSGTGEITVRGLHATRIEVQTANGKIEADGLDAPDVSATSAAGDVGVEAVRVPDALRAHSSAGSVAVSVPDASYALEASAPAGRVINGGIRNDTASTHKLSVTSDAGDVVVAKH